VLSGAFPRTWRWAALELGIASAKRRHEEVLARPTALHLFSDQLPFRRLASAWLAEGKTGGDPSRIEEFAGWTTQRATDSLRAWTGMPPAVGEIVGSGLLLGRLTSSELHDAATLVSVARQLAAAYLDLDEFRAPYFDLAR
jgi:hypothetical protein